MKELLTLNDTVPQVIEAIKDLKQDLLCKKINLYTTNLVLSGILYSLEHPEKHFSDGSVVF